ncbi:MAG TPA: Hsp20/alpha crystallin family protein [Thermoanaerobaculaceae bacterium]|nr:Hsp20/alpha crystallin family protein [Thermoanaerobaculaceae bacterium]
MSDLDWRAVRELMSLAERLREATERALLPPSAVALGRPAAFEPPVDVWESEREIIVEAELPGVGVADVDLRLENGALVLSGTLPATGESPGAHLRIERPRGRFERVVHLPEPVAGEPRATLKGGVLEVRLPKAGTGRRRVPVEREGA